MNDYHRTHSDPEIREKYRRWLNAKMNSNASAAGCNSQEEFNEMEARKKASQKSVGAMLKAVGGMQVKGSNLVKSRTTKQTHKRMIRTSSQRGS